MATYTTRPPRPIPKTFINIGFFHFRSSVRTSTSPTSWSTTATSLKPPVTSTVQSFFILEDLQNFHAKIAKKTRNLSENLRHRHQRDQLLLPPWWTVKSGAIWSCFTTASLWTSYRLSPSSLRGAEWASTPRPFHRSQSWELTHSLHAERSQICIR